MKRILISIITLLTFNGIAQQFPEFSQYLQNDYLLNPAQAGTKDYAPVCLSTRIQWMNFQNAPSSQLGSIHGSVTKNIGLGLGIINHTAGATKMTSASFAYSYRIQLKEKTGLSFGIAPMFTQHALNKDKLTLDNANDLTFNRINTRTMVVDANAGIHLFAEKYFVSVCMPQLMASKIRMGDALFTEKNRRHLVVTGAYEIPVNEKWSVSPGAVIKTQGKGAPLQWDINAKATYDNFIWGGLIYRGSTGKMLNESAILFLGLTKANFAFGYSFDYSFGAIRTFNGGSHEIFLGYRINCKGEKIVAKEQ